MKAFNTITGVAAPMLLADVNTDVIIPTKHLASLSPSELGPFAFEPLRFRSDGSENIDFVLNQGPYRSAPILLAGKNFGCGSSREAAVWALMGRGIQCVIAPSFGDIFYDNSFQNGLLPIELAPGDIESLSTSARSLVPFRVDLSEQSVAVGANVVHFEIDVWRREAMLLGLDSIELSLSANKSILQWQCDDRQKRPWAWIDVHQP